MYRILYENSVLRRIFGPKVKEVPEEILYCNEELYSLYSLNAIRVINEGVWNELDMHNT
jgi:hypothetical protein